MYATQSSSGSWRQSNHEKDVQHGYGSGSASQSPLFSTPTISSNPAKYWPPKLSSSFGRHAHCPGNCVKYTLASVKHIIFFFNPVIIPYIFCSAFRSLWKWLAPKMFGVITKTPGGQTWQLWSPSHLWIGRMLCTWVNTRYLLTDFLAPQQLKVNIFQCMEASHERSIFSEICGSCLGVYWRLMWPFQKKAKQTQIA